MTTNSPLIKRTQKTNTIFIVDHDQENLHQFKTLFQKHKNLVYYSTSPDEVASVMEGVSPDLVLGNFHMQELSAEYFFRYVKKKAPHAIRAVYSQESDRTELMRLLAIGNVHRFFCLPWQKNGIDLLLTRDLQTRASLRTRKVCDFLESEDRIPVLPEVVREIEKALQNPDHSIGSIANIIERDPVISSKLLHVVNSAAFPKKSQIAVLKHAVAYLGIKQVREVIIFICARDIFPPSPKGLEAAQKVGEMSFRCSKLASLVAATICPGSEKEAATAALLHDIGKMVFFALSYYETYIRGMRNGRGEYNPIDFQAEQDEGPFGISHTELGSCLLLWWDMPLSIIETASNHRLPLKQISDIARSVAIAYRCLVQAAHPGKEYAEFKEIRSMENQWPVDRWLEDAHSFLQM